MMKFLANVLISTLLTLCTGCASTKTAFNSNADIDETMPQQRAVIELSDPQVFARESLINDRRREAEYLQTLLDESTNRDKVKFGSQLRRDLRTITDVSAQMAASVDPAKALNFNWSKQIQDLQQQVAAAELRQRLAALERPDSSAPGASPMLSATGQASLPQGATAGEDKSSKLPDVKRPADMPGVGGLLGQVMAGSTPTPDEMLVSPQEEFRDRQAYRSDLRAAFSAVNLDDRHDSGGHSLQRLQFKVTVIPGQYKNKWGVARVNVLQPALESEEIDDLYLSWLAHATYRLNQVVQTDLGGQGENQMVAVDKAERSELVPDERYQVLGTGVGLFAIESLLYSSVDASATAQDSGCKGAGQGKVLPSNCQVLRLAFNPVHDAELQSVATLLEGASTVQKAESDKQGKDNVGEEGLYRNKSFDTILDQGAKALAVIKKLQGEEDLQKLVIDASTCERWSHGEALHIHVLQTDEAYHRAFHIARSYILIAPSVVASVQGLGDRKYLTERSKKNIDAMLNKFSLNLRDAQHFIRLVEKANEKSCPAIHVEELERSGRKAPDLFKRLLTQPFDDADGHHQNPLSRKPSSKGLGATERSLRGADEKRVVRGQVYPYASSPVELSQRMSTVASAANSAEFAFALAAAHPASGIGAETALSYLRNAAGRIDAVQRSPLVVGFSVPKGFGWVLGPKTVPDTEKNKLLLRHSVATYDVSVDLSIPSWWPRLALDVQTAWVGNWADADNGGGGDPLGMLSSKPVNRREIVVSLPRTRADYDGITSYLASKTIGSGLQQTRITRIEPFWISACAKQATLLIAGSNLWRSPEAYLNGVKGKNVSVLPNMEGIAATFDLEKDVWNQSQTRPQSLLLSVWARNGSEERNIPVIGRLNGTACDDAGVASLKAGISSSTAQAVAIRNKVGETEDSTAGTGVQTDAGNDRVANPNTAPLLMIPASPNSPTPSLPRTTMPGGSSQPSVSAQPQLAPMSKDRRALEFP